MELTEGIAVVLGLVSVYLVTRQNVWCYPLGIVSVAIYVVIFFDVKLYADMGLQFFFIALQLYGWYEWLHGGENKTELHVSRAPLRMYAVTALFVLSFSVLLGYLLRTWTDASLPFVDSLLAVMSMAAQWMMARKYIENWILWTVVNAGSIAMFGVKELYFTMALYGVYLILGIVGFFTWKKSMVHQPGPSA